MPEPFANGFHDFVFLFLQVVDVFLQAENVNLSSPVSDFELPRIGLFQDHGTFFFLVPWIRHGDVFHNPCFFFFCRFHGSVRYSVCFFVFSLYIGYRFYFNRKISVFGYDSLDDFLCNYRKILEYMDTYFLLFLFHIYKNLQTIHHIFF